MGPSGDNANGEEFARRLQEELGSAAASLPQEPSFNTISGIIPSFRGVRSQQTKGMQEERRGDNRNRGRLLPTGT